ncbi:GNAT family N-acetyltransferase [Mitsuaria sp. WAJ17]|uniref:GNAT family N-acetyltransferase n=1 Tax=Mitsuaria sp. WAJ17 TaxID=2761452 RepID=UPI0016008AF3|nr:GNAT family protein [Mitsuaria sp. WAJ17]MBB2484032.1 GNAT family N-acetyltransferase [Mitsuaria sp. WAJ17]
MSTPARFFLRSPRSDDLARVHGWMADPAVHGWFDFGQGRQQVSTVALTLMARSPQYCMKVFGEQGTDAPLGIVVLSEVQHPFGSAHFWVVRDRWRSAYRGITAEASRALLHEGFDRLGRCSVNAWAVETNERSLRLLQDLGFQVFGVQQACHRLGGRLLGRVHLELLPERFYRQS